MSVMTSMRGFSGMPGDLSRDDVKIALKEGLKEWLDDRWKFAADLTLKSLVRAAALAIFGGVVYMVLIANGWHKGP